jgi:hypothetical protein
MSIRVEGDVVAPRDECCKGLTRSRYGLIVWDAMMSQQPRNEGLSEQADAVNQLRSLFEQGPAQRCDLFPGGCRQRNRGISGIEI